MATITNPGAKTALSGYPTQIIITGTVAAAPPITWTLQTPPSGVSIASASPTTAIVTVTRECPSNAPLVLSITVLADESGQDQSTATFSVTVTPRPTSPAVLAAVGAL